MEDSVNAGSGSGDEIDDQASAWAVRFAERPLDADEQQQLDAWLSSGSRQLGAFIRARALWLDLDRIAAFGSGVQSGSLRGQSLPKWKPLAMAAVVVLTMINGVIAFDHFEGRISTTRGEVRRIALEDGSILTLNGDSTVQVRYDDEVRQIVLKKGEASFDVAHDVQKPFVVTAEGLNVRAVGTEFLVALDNKSIAVTVEEGVVAVGGKASGLVRPRFISRNEQFTLAPTGTRKAVLDDSDLERKIAWRKGQLVFNGQRLGDAADEVNRYSDLRIVIEDPTLARAEFMGVFKLGDSYAFAGAAAHAFNARVIRRGKDLILVRNPNSPSH